MQQHSSMSLPSSPRNPEWQPTRVPKLAYRKAISEEEANQLKVQARQESKPGSNVSRTKSSHSSATRAPWPAESFAPTKKKNSFFSGLFAKEPTRMALAQVEADLKAKHGAATPQTVPHVSARKIPDHVPKVNSKWDGVPEVVKQREREEKQRERKEKQQRRISQQSSHAAHQSVRSHSTDSSMRNKAHQQRNRPRRESDTISGTESWRSPGGTMSSCYPPSLYSTSSEETREVRGRHLAHSVRSQSLRSPSGTSLPEITSFFPHHEQQPIPAIPQRWQSVNSTTTNSTKSSDQSRSDYSQQEYHSTTIDVIPEHSSSPVGTPRETSPVTPSHVSDRAASSIQSLSKSDKSGHGPTTRSKRVVPGQIDAFLAGEAQPLTLMESQGKFPKDTDLPLRMYQQSFVHRVETDIAKRPDSSRARLGLRASMMVPTEAAPWETQSAPRAASNSQGPAQKSRLPKALALFK